MDGDGDASVLPLLAESGMVEVTVRREDQVRRMTFQGFLDGLPGAAVVGAGVDENAHAAAVNDVKIVVVQRDAREDWHGRESSVLLRYGAVPRSAGTGTVPSSSLRRRA